MEQNTIHPPKKTQHSSNSSCQQSPGACNSMVPKGLPAAQTDRQDAQTAADDGWLLCLSQRYSQDNSVSCSENAGCNTMWFVYLSNLWCLLTLKLNCLNSPHPS